MPHTQGQKGGGVEGQENSRLPREKSTMVTQIIRSFLPEAKPTGHRTVRVVVAVVVGDYFEVTTSKDDPFLLKTCYFYLTPSSPTQNFLWGEIRRFLISDHT